MRKKTESPNLEIKKKYIAFLQKRVNSENYKKNVSSEEFEKTKEKLKKEKTLIKLLYK